MFNYLRETKILFPQTFASKFLESSIWQAIYILGRCLVSLSRPNSSSACKMIWNRQVFLLQVQLVWLKFVEKKLNIASTVFTKMNTRFCLLVLPSFVFEVESSDSISWPYSSSWNKWTTVLRAWSHWNTVVEIAKAVIRLRRNTYRKETHFLGNHFSPVIC